MISQEDVKNFDLLREKQDSKDLKKYLIDKGCLCGDNEHEQERRVALHILETIVNEWTFEQYKKHNNNPIVYPALITFGSYRLGVHRRDSDIDVLSLFADTVSREDFFSSFPEFLAKDKRVSKLLSVKNAYTPVVKFYLNGIHIDALFGNVSDANKLIHFHNNKRQQNHDTSREEYTIVDTDLSGLDQPGVRSLNGVRVTQFIENSISNMERFRICLGAIKEWAVLNGVYSNQMGFLGGINFAILLTKICIDYPESESLPPTALLKLFFYTYSLWEWPEPVMLTKTLQYETPLEIDTMQCWDPTLNSRDVMPIITPAYPSSKSKVPLTVYFSFAANDLPLCQPANIVVVNSSYNVGLPQKRRIQEEMIRATILLWQEEEEVDDEKERGWSVILKEADFFKRHRYDSFSCYAVFHLYWIQYLTCSLYNLVTSYMCQLALRIQIQKSV
jgi:poly(A) polymerase